MTERERIDAFTRRLDQLLKAGGPTEVPESDPDEQERLTLAMELDRLDVAGESLVREGLGRALTDRIAPPSGNPIESPIRRSRFMNRLRSPLLTGGLAAALVVIALAIFSPGTLAALTRPILAVIKRVAVGEHTELIQHETTDQETVEALVFDLQAELAAGRQWYLQTPYGASGGPVPEGAEPCSRQYADLAPLLRAASFDLLVPGTWPEHIPEFLRFQKGWLNPDGSVQILFLIGPQEFALMQTPVGEDRAVSHSESTTDGEGHVVGHAIDVETFEWDGVTVTWQEHVEGWERQMQFARERGEDDPPYGALLWEHDGVSYRLDGQNLTLERAEEIFRSLEKAEAG